MTTTNSTPTPPTSPVTPGGGTAAPAPAPATASRSTSSTAGSRPWIQLTNVTPFGIAAVLGVIGFVIAILIAQLNIGNWNFSSVPTIVLGLGMAVGLVILGDYVYRKKDLKVGGVALMIGGGFVGFLQLIGPVANLVSGVSLGWLTASDPLALFIGASVLLTAIFTAYGFYWLAKTGKPDAVIKLAKVVAYVAVGGVVAVVLLGRQGVEDLLAAFGIARGTNLDLLIAFLQSPDAIFRPASWPWTDAYWPWVLGLLGIFVGYDVLRTLILGGFRGFTVFALVLALFFNTAYQTNSNIQNGVNAGFSWLTGGDEWDWSESPFVCAEGSTCRAERNAAEAERVRLLREAELKAEANAEAARAEARARTAAAEAARIEAEQRAFAAQCDAQHPWQTLILTNGQVKTRGVRDGTGLEHFFWPERDVLIDDPRIDLRYTGSSTGGQYVSVPRNTRVHAYHFQIEGPVDEIVYYRMAWPGCPLSPSL